MQEISLKKIEGIGVDREARFLSKKGRPHFGYKRHFGVDDNGLVLGVHTAAANEHDSKGLAPLLEKINKKYTKKGIFTDKGYKTKTNDQLLRSKNIKNRIQHRAYRNRPLSDWQIKFNQLISKTRWVVERTFGGQALWFGSGKTRYKGKDKLHAQLVLEAICYNLKRSPKLAILLAI